MAARDWATVSLDPTASSSDISIAAPMARPSIRDLGESFADGPSATIGHIGQPRSASDEVGASWPTSRKPPQSSLWASGLEGVSEKGLWLIYLNGDSSSIGCMTRVEEVSGM